jgi:hypothetical protein
LLGHARALASDPRFDQSFQQLIDLREVTDLDFPSSTIRSLAQMSPWGFGARRAVVVGTDVAFGMARMYQILREPDGEDVRIFRGVEPALEWLGLATDEAAIIAALSEAPALPRADSAQPVS